MNKLFPLLILISCIVLGGCDKDAETDESIRISTLLVNDTLPDIISENIELVTGRTWYIHGYTYVVNDAALIIQPGTTIKMIPQAKKDTSTFGAGLIVTRGAKIIASGTENLPVIFEYSQYVPGSAVRPWFGVVVLGRSPVHSAKADTMVYIPAMKMSFTYGGDLEQDSSGVMKHVIFKNTDRSGPPGYLPVLRLLGAGSRTICSHIHYE